MLYFAAVTVSAWYGSLELSLLATALASLACAYLFLRLCQSEERYRQIVETTGDGIWIIDAESKTSFANSKIAELLGYTVDEMLGMSLFEFMDAENQVLAAAKVERRRQGIKEQHDFKFCRKDGSVLWAMVSASPMFDQIGQYAGSLGIVIDVTERKQIEEERTQLLAREQQARAEAEAARQRFLDLVQGLDAIVTEVDAQTWQFSFVSQRAEAILGYPIERWLTEPGFFVNLVHPDDLEEITSSCRAAIAQGRDHEFEYRALAADGQVVWLRDFIRVILDDSGCARQLLGVMVDITESKQAEEKLLHNALYDPLTGLANRVLFIDRLEHAIEYSKRHKDYRFAVFFLDLDRFKLINDSLGHPLGDELLIAVASRLKACLRPTDTAARLGGDEFTILLEGINDVSDTIRVAERIQQELALPFVLGEQEVFVTTSIGIALNGQLAGILDYEQPSDLLRAADTAMYRAKALGKARYEIFNTDMYATALGRLQLETDLHRAMERQEFQVYYQPIVSLKIGRIIGFEALVRWQHPRRGLLSPEEFLSLLEETGLSVALDQWVLRTACRQMRSWQMAFPAEPPLAISVNFCSNLFAQANLIEQVNTILHETGLDAPNLKLEITESVIVENALSATDMLLQLKALGIQLVIDDFGTGYSSLGRLHSLPIDVLKIDRSFISHTGTGLTNSEIVNTIVTLAHNLGMDVTAEGVETKEQLALIRELKCEYGQGYFFSVPLSTSATEAILLANPQW